MKTKKSCIEPLSIIDLMEFNKSEIKYSLDDISNMHFNVGEKIGYNDNNIV